MGNFNYSSIIFKKKYAVFRSFLVPTLGELFTLERYLQILVQQTESESPVTVLIVK